MQPDISEIHLVKINSLQNVNSETKVSETFVAELKYTNIAQDMTTMLHQKRRDYD